MFLRHPTGAPLITIVDVEVVCMFYKLVEDSLHTFTWPSLVTNLFPCSHLPC